jgi:hypothetical protein
MENNRNVQREREKRETHTERQERVINVIK